MMVQRYESFLIVFRFLGKNVVLVNGFEVQYHRFWGLKA